MRGRCTDPRPARVHVLVLTRPPHTHACTHVQRGYTKSGLYWLEVKGASGHRRAAQIAANLDDWTQRGPEKERGEAGPSGGSLGYCDMTSMGGGWLMCYTSQGEVDVANEVASRMRLRVCMAVPPRIAPSERGGVHARSLAACTCAPVPTDERERDHVFIGNQREQLQKEPARANLPLPSPLMFWGRCLSVDFEGIWGRC